MKKLLLALALLTIPHISASAAHAAPQVAAQQTVEQQLEQYRKCETDAAKVAALNQIFAAPYTKQEESVLKQIAIELNNLYRDNQFQVLEKLVMGDVWQDAIRTVNPNLTALSYSKRKPAAAADGPYTLEESLSIDAANLILKLARKKEFADKHPYDVAQPIAQQFITQWQHPTNHDFLAQLRSLVKDSQPLYCSEVPCWIGAVASNAVRAATIRVIKYYREKKLPPTLVPNPACDLDLLFPRFADVPDSVIPVASQTYKQRLATNMNAITGAVQQLPVDIARIIAGYMTPWGISLAQANKYLVVPKQSTSLTNYDEYDPNTPWRSERMFVHTPLYLSDSAIVNATEQIPDTEFTGCYRYADLSNNAIPLAPHIFAWRLLQELNLSNNGIESIPDCTFGSLPNLQCINLSNNPLVRITNADAFAGPKGLRVLDLSNTKLTHVDMEWLGELNELRWLMLTGNEGVKIPWGLIAEILKDLTVRKP